MDIDVSFNKLHHLEIVNINTNVYLTTHLKKIMIDFRILCKHLIYNQSQNNTEIYKIVKSNTKL